MPFPKRSRRNYISINTLYREVDYYYDVLINKSLLERFSLLFCLLTLCYCGTWVLWKSYNNCVLQILLLRTYAVLVGIKVRLGFYHGTRRSMCGKTCCHR